MMLWLQPLSQFNARYGIYKRRCEIVHIGDSLNNDIKGASNLGINTIWINRNNKEIPDGVIAVTNCTEIFNTPFFTSVKM